MLVRSIVMNRMLPGPATSLPGGIFGMADAGDITAFNLQGGVVDVEMMAQVFVGLVQKVVGAARRHDQVGGQDIFRGTGRPDMQIMNALHSRQPG